MPRGNYTGIGAITKPGASSPGGLETAPFSFATFEAAGAIPIHNVVALDPSDTSGRTVLQYDASAHAPSQFLGVYSGKGGSGASSSAGDGGNAAVAGDFVQIITWGICKCQVSASGVAAGDGLAPEADSASDGELGDIATESAVSPAFATALSAEDSDDIATIKIH